jgi:hypothetical protein
MMVKPPLLSPKSVANTHVGAKRLAQRRKVIVNFNYNVITIRRSWAVKNVSRETLFVKWVDGLDRESSAEQEHRHDRAVCQ